MSMTFSTALMAFVGNGIVFIILSIVVTKFVAKLPKFRDSFAYLGLRVTDNFKKQVILGLGFALLMPLIQLLSMTVFGLLVSPSADMSLSEILSGYYGTIVNAPIGQTGIGGKIVLGLCMITFVGFGEEIFFRGMIQKALTSKIGVILGIILTAIVFTLMHGFYMLDFPIAVASGSSLFIVSIVFGLLRHKTDSLIPSIIAHGVGNAIIYTMAAHIFYNMLS